MVLKEGVNEITYVGAQCSLRHTRVPARPTLPSSRSSHGSPTGSLGSSQLYSSEKPRDALNVTWKVSGGVRTRHTSVSCPPGYALLLCAQGLPSGSSPSGYLVGEEEERREHTRARTHSTHSQPAGPAQPNIFSQ